MKVFIDTNIFLDYIQKRAVGFEEANKIFELAAKNCITMLVSDLTIANTKYTTRRIIPLKDFYETITDLRELFTITGIGAEAVDKALAIKARDFEDALQYFAAEQADADCIITRNIKDFIFASTVKVLEPKAFIESYFPEELQ